MVSDSPALPVPLSLPEFGALLGMKDTSGLEWHEVLIIMNPKALPNKIFPRLLATVMISEPLRSPKPGMLPPYELAAMTERVFCLNEKMMKSLVRAINQEAPKSIETYRALLTELRHPSSQTLQRLYFDKALALAKTADDFENLWFATSLDSQRHRILVKVGMLNSWDTLEDGMLLNYGRFAMDRSFADHLLHRVAHMPFVENLDKLLHIYSAVGQWDVIRSAIERKLQEQFPSKKSDWKNEEFVEKAIALFAQCVVRADRETPLRNMAARFLHDILEYEETVFEITLSPKSLKDIRYAERQLAKRIPSSSREWSDNEKSNIQSLRMACLRRIAKAVSNHNEAVEYLHSVGWAQETAHLIPGAHALVKKYST